MELIRRREAERALNKIMNSSDPERVIDGLSRSIVDKIFHDIAISIREAAERGDDNFLSMCAELFNCRNLK